MTKSWRELKVRWATLNSSHPLWCIVPFIALIPHDAMDAINQFNEVSRTCSMLALTAIWGFLVIETERRANRYLVAFRRRWLDYSYTVSFENQLPLERLLHSRLLSRKDDWSDWEDTIQVGANFSYSVIPCLTRKSPAWLNYWIACEFPSLKFSFTPRPTWNQVIKGAKMK